MSNKNRPLRVFLCHAHSDAPAVHILYRQLKRDGVDAWLDKERLLPGADWELEISKAVRESDVVVVCLSKQFNQAGFRQKEVKLALDTALEQPEGEIFIIPARLEACDTLNSLRKLHWVDLFETNGYQRLIKTLRLRAERIGASLRHRGNQPTTAPPKSNESEKPTASSISSQDLPEAFSLNSLKLFFPQAVPILRIVSVIAIIVILFWIGSRAMRQNLSAVPTGNVSTTTLSSTASAQPVIATVTNSALLSPTLPNLSPVSSLLPGSTIQHGVTEGDSLVQIAHCYGANVDRVLNENSEINDPNNLKPGTIVIVSNIGSSGKIYGPPCIVIYIVQSEDTWSSIAQKHDADLAILQILNPGELSVDSVLYIPQFQVAPPLTFPQDSTTVKKNGTLPPNGAITYPVPADQDQMMRINVIATGTPTLSVLNPSGMTFKPLDNLLVWNGIVPETGNYTILILSNTNGLQYSMEISIQEK